MKSSNYCCPLECVLLPELNITVTPDRSVEHKRKSSTRLTFQEYKWRGGLVLSKPRKMQNKAASIGRAYPYRTHYNKYLVGGKVKTGLTLLLIDFYG